MQERLEMSRIRIENTSILARTCKKKHVYVDSMMRDLVYTYLQMYWTKALSLPE